MTDPYSNNLGTFINQIINGNIASIYDTGLTGENKAAVINNLHAQTDTMISVFDLPAVPCGPKDPLRARKASSAASSGSAPTKGRQMTPGRLREVIAEKGIVGTPV